MSNQIKNVHTSRLPTNSANIYKMNIDVSPNLLVSNTQKKEEKQKIHNCSWRLKQLSKPSTITPKYKYPDNRCDRKDYILDCQTINFPNRLPLWFPDDTSSKFGRSINVSRIHTSEVCQGIQRMIYTKQQRSTWGVRLKIISSN
uniref:Uncharacterized protein LOC114339562 isoform X1 n=1 Tax=Diabrotica virgifera virgifera TaxID=50390 RepID=A0A6P7GLB1_DIAVI